MATIELYDIWREWGTIVKWKGPGGIVHQVDTSDVPASKWAYDNDDDPNIGYRQGYAGIPGRIVVSLEGNPSGHRVAATLLHKEDDVPRRVMFATDGGNGSHGHPKLNKKPTFILEVSNFRDCPVEINAGYRVMVVS